MTADETPQPAKRVKPAASGGAKKVSPPAASGKAGSGKATAKPTVAKSAKPAKKTTDGKAPVRSAARAARVSGGAAPTPAPAPSASPRRAANKVRVEAVPPAGTLDPVVSVPAAAAPGVDDPYGRRIFFDGVPPEGRGPFRIECSRCNTTSKVSLAGVVGAHLPFFVWVPVMRNSHFIRCPHCGQRSWVRLRLSL